MPDWLRYIIEFMIKYVKNGAKEKARRGEFFQTKNSPY